MKRVCSNTAPAPGPTSRIRGDGEPLSGGGKSSGLMSFLKIGDRAAVRDQIGRHHAPRGQNGRSSISDHPDIENFINWKVIEEQKVAALVAGSKLHNKNLNRSLHEGLGRTRTRTSRMTRSKTKL